MLARASKVLATGGEPRRAALSLACRAMTGQGTQVWPPCRRCDGCSGYPSRPGAQPMHWEEAPSNPNLCR